MPMALRLVKCDWSMLIGDRIAAYADDPAESVTDKSAIVRTGLDGRCVVRGVGPVDPDLLTLLCFLMFGLERRGVNQCPR